MKILVLTSLLFIFNIDLLPQTPFWQQTDGPYGGEVVSLGVDSSGVIFAGNKTFSEIFRSTDEGRSWTRCSNDYSFGFTTTSDGNTLTASVHYVLKSYDHGLNWSKRESGLASAYLNAIAAVDSNIVLAGGYSGIYRSTNFGDSWSQSNIGITSLDIRAIGISPSGTVYCGTSDGYLFYSTNKGYYWNATIRDSSYNGISSIAFDPGGNLLLGTTYGVYKTTDNGSTWSHKTIGLGGPAVFSLQHGVGGEFFAATWYGGVYRSTDGAETWTQVNAGLSTSDINAVLIRPNNVVLIGTRNRGVFRSPDNGDSWARVGLTNSIISSFLTLGDSLYAASTGPRTYGLFRTTNRGLQWTQLTSDYQGPFECITKNSANTLFGGSGGGIMRSNDFGFTWSQVDTNIITSILVHRTGTLIAGSYGVVRSSDNGVTWSRVFIGSNLVTRCLATDSSGLLYAGTTGGMYKSSDTGLSWDTCGLQNYDVTALTLGQSNSEIVAAVGGGIYISLDQGASWLNVYGNLRDTLVTGFARNSAGDLFASTSGKGVIRSTDGGNTWSEVESGLSTRYVRSITIDPSDFAYAGVYGDGVFRSVVPTTTVEEHHNKLPEEFMLCQNYPNPFNPITTISYTLPHRSHVSLIVYDMLGMRARTLIEGDELPGSHNVVFDGAGLASGVYYYRLQAGDYTETKKLLLLR